MRTPCLFNQCSFNNLCFWHEGEEFCQDDLVEGERYTLTNNADIKFTSDGDVQFSGFFIAFRGSEY